MEDNYGKYTHIKAKACATTGGFMVNCPATDCVQSVGRPKKKRLIKEV